MDEGQDTGCIDENAALDFAQGRLFAPEVQRIDAHADACARCRLLVDEAVRAFRERATVEGVAGPQGATMFRPGDEIADRYRIVRFIARGGMGEVYEAEDRILNAHIAIKTVNATISDDPVATRLLKQEVSFARRITHENVCRIYDVGVHVLSGYAPRDRVLFLTMELISGISLGERLRRAGPLGPTEARPIFQAMIAGIGAAHRAGIVHRDLKTDNVMLADPGGPAPRVVVMDFGLARKTSSTRADSGAVPSSLDLPGTGTLPYMAPEQIEGRPTSVATDIYALGIVMFELLSGQLPFRRDTLFGALQRLQGDAPLLREAAPGIDPAWEVLVARCLQRDPLRRPQSMEEVARGLPIEGRETDGLAAPAVAVPTVPRTARRTRVLPAIAAAVAMILGVALAVRAARRDAASLAARIKEAQSIRAPEARAPRMFAAKETSAVPANETANAPARAGVLTAGTSPHLNAQAVEGDARKTAATAGGRAHHGRRAGVSGPVAQTPRPATAAGAAPEATSHSADPAPADHAGGDVAATPRTRSQDPEDGFGGDDK